MPRVHLVHGINTSGAHQAPELLIPYLQAAGFDVRYPDYGYITGIATGIMNSAIVGTLLPYIEPGDIAIGHSNGCAIIYDAMHLGAPFGGAVLIDGALLEDIVRPIACRWIDVYFNAGDTVVEAAKVAQQLHLDDPNWGDLGHIGYKGTDAAISNVDCGNSPPLPVVSGHSDIFTKLSAWGPAIIERIKSHVPPS